jgi:hypothetical protein
MEITLGRTREGLELRTGTSNKLKYRGVALLHLIKRGMYRILSRFNLKETIRELKNLGKKHGPYFLAYAILIEFLEDLAIPAILYSVGKPHLIPAALAFHCEPIAYPVYFAVAAAVRRLR